MDDDRRLLNNPFVRALRDSPEPDDPKATSPGMYIVFGLLSLVLVALFVAALILPPLLTYSLVLRGLRTGRPAMVVVGAGMALLYFLIFFALGRRLMSKRSDEPPS